MSVVKIGLDVTDEGLKFYGSEKVNELIKNGSKVISIEPNQFFIKENTELDTEDSESITLTGWEMIVLLEE